MGINICSQLTELIRLFLCTWLAYIDYCLEAPTISAAFNHGLNPVHVVWDLCIDSEFIPFPAAIAKAGHAQNAPMGSIGVPGKTETDY